MLDIISEETSNLAILIGFDRFEIQKSIKGNEGDEYYPHVTISLIKNWLWETHKLNVIPKFYESGSYAYSIYKHNGDATGSSRISAFMSKSYYTYNEAMEGGLQEAIKTLIPKPK